MSHLHVVTGAGPVGSTIALQLAERGHHVRLLTRSGSGPEHPCVERRRADASHRPDLAAALDGAVALHHCIHGSAYAASTWRAELPRAEQAVLAEAGAAGAVVVFPESLYSYGPTTGPMSEDTPRVATKGKLGVRTDLLRAREASDTATVSVAASDFYGPQVRTAHAGDRMVPTVLAGKTMRVLGNPDLPHSWTYVPDLAAAMIRAAELPAVHNTVIHAPTAQPMTQRELVQLFATTAGVETPKISPLPIWALRGLGLVHAGSRELAETGYMFNHPFVLDSARSQELLGIAPTPMEVGAKATVDWWREEIQRAE